MNEQLQVHTILIVNDVKLQVKHKWRLVWRIWRLHNQWFVLVILQLCRTYSFSRAGALITTLPKDDLIRNQWMMNQRFVHSREDSTLEYMLLFPLRIHGCCQRIWFACILLLSLRTSLFFRGRVLIRFSNRIASSAKLKVKTRVQKEALLLDLEFLIRREKLSSFLSYAIYELRFSMLRVRTSDVLGDQC